MTIIVELPPEVEGRLREQATARGESVEDYVRGLVLAAAGAGPDPHDKARPANLEDRFQRLAAQWRKAVGPLSCVTRITQHPAYREIISLGREVVPLILRDLERQPDHWFTALREITGADPVPPEDQGRIERMAAAWVRWGKDHGAW
jgi:hypothetical protein